MPNTPLSSSVAGRPHPAKYSDSILAYMLPYLHGKVLDPFAGTGKLRLVYPDAYLNEIEPEWATQNGEDRVTIGDARKLDYPDEFFDVIATSPCYGNRMADHHNARDASERITYRHKLGRELTPGNSGSLQWGKEYRTFHLEAWTECTRVLRHGGSFLLNVSNHIRDGKEVRVCEWHKLWFLTHGYEVVAEHPIPTPRMRRGANYDQRVEFEYLYVMERL